MKCKADIVMTHKDGETITIAISGAKPELVAHVANTIKAHYKPTGSHIMQTDRQKEHDRSLMRMYYDFARDFFRFGR